MPGGGYVGYLGCFAVLLMLAKLVEKQKIRFYWAGLVYAIADALLLIVPMYLAQLLMGAQTANVFTQLVMDWWHILIIAIGASVLFWLLDRYSETIAAWMVTFVAGYILLVVVL